MALRGDISVPDDIEREILESLGADAIVLPETGRFREYRGLDADDTVRAKHSPGSTIPIDRARSFSDAPGTAVGFGGRPRAKSIFLDVIVEDGVRGVKTNVDEAETVIMCGQQIVVEDTSEVGEMHCVQRRSVP